MMPFALTTSQVVGFFLIFTRIGGLMLSAPIFSSPRMPLQLRAGISLLLAFLLQPVLAPDGPGTPASLFIFLAMLVREAAIGLMIGYVANLIFSIVEMAGELQDTQAGFGFAGVVDPTMSRPSAILGQFQIVVMWLIFFAVHGHLVLLQALSDSFRLVPLGTFAYAPALTGNLLQLLLHMLFIAVRISAPVLAAVLLSDLALGALQRTAPQLNIIAVGFPIKITVAVVVLALALPFLTAAWRDLVPFMHDSVHRMLTN